MHCSLNSSVSALRSQSSLDSTNGFAFVAHDMNKDLEQKTMREYRNDLNVSENDGTDGLIVESCSSFALQMHEKLFDFLSEQCTFDHPLCQVCAMPAIDRSYLGHSRNAPILCSINWMSI